MKIDGHMPDFMEHYHKLRDTLPQFAREAYTSAFYGQFQKLAGALEKTRETFQLLGDEQQERLKKQYQAVELIRQTVRMFADALDQMEAAEDATGTSDHRAARYAWLAVAECEDHPACNCLHDTPMEDIKALQETCPDFDPAHACALEAVYTSREDGKDFTDSDFTYWRVDGQTYKNARLIKRNPYFDKKPMNFGKEQ